MVENFRENEGGISFETDSIHSPDLCDLKNNPLTNRSFTPILFHFKYAPNHSDKSFTTVQYVFSRIIMATGIDRWSGDVHQTSIHQFGGNWQCTSRLCWGDFVT